MKIEKPYSLRVAEKVLAEVKREFRLVKQENTEALLGLYSNGREKGFHISNYFNKRAISFSEFRRSDNIVVYFGTLSQFERNTHIPDDGVYCDAKFFECGDYKGAAKFIKEYLVG